MNNIFLNDVFDDGSSNNMGIDATLSCKSHIWLEKLQFIESCAPQTFVLFCKFANKEKSSQMSKLSGMCLCYYKWLVGHIVHIRCNATTALVAHACVHMR